MKRRLTGLLCLALAVSSSAQAHGTVTHSISDDGVGFSVTYSDTDEFTKATLMMLKGSQLVYMGEKSLDNAVNSVTFDEFRIDIDKWLTGEYVFKVGANKNITTSDAVTFVNPNQKKSVFLSVINPTVGKDAATVNSLLGDLSAYIDFGYEDNYSALGEKRKEQICKSIIDLNLYQKYTSDADNTEDLIVEFCSFMNKMYEAASIMDASNADDVVSKIDNAKILQFDRTYFSNDTEKNPDSKFVYDRNVIAQAIVNHNFDQYDSINEDKIYEVLNGNTLLYVINNNDYATAESALKHFENDTYMKIDYTSYSRLSAAQKAKVFSDIKKENISDYTTIPTRFKSISDGILGSGSGNDSGLSYGGSNKGGSSFGKGTGSSGNGSGTTTTPSGNSDNEVFSDIADVEWAGEAIAELKKLGVIDGVGNGRYEPNSAVSREALVKMIILAYDMKVDNASSSFTDVANDAWSYPYVSSALASGLVTGVTDTFFDAESSISREDAAVIIYRAYEKKVGSVEASESFADESDIAEYAVKAVAAMKNLGVINGYEDGSFRPKKSITRAECAKMIYIAYKLLN